MSPDLVTGAVQAAVQPTALLGEWRLARSVQDDRAGLSGTVSGKLTLLADGDEIVWREQGTLLWNGSLMPVSRSYRLRRVGDGWWLYFDDGRPFHPWKPGVWVFHPCSEDEYHGLVTINSPDSWHTCWQVRGPGTAQRISTHFSRSTAAPAVGW